MKQNHKIRIRTLPVLVTSIIMLLIFSACGNPSENINVTKNTNENTNVVKETTSVLSSRDLDSATAFGDCGDSGDNVTWALYDDGELVISGTGAMEDYNSRDDAPWHRRYYDFIKSVTIGNDITSIGSNAFNSCYRLSSVVIGDCVLTIGGHAFDSCGLTEITITDNVTNIDFCAFYDCEDLATIKIGKGVTSIGNSAFSFCDSLISVTIPSSVTSIGAEAFNNCESLTSIIVDEDNSAYSSDKNGVLFNKDKSELVLYPKGKAEYSYTIPSSVTRIGDNAFAWCENITNMTIPNSVTSLGECAFDGCTKLNSITISESVSNIEYAAFLNCSNLYTVYYTGTEEQWNDITIGGCNDKLLDSTIYYNS